MEDPAIVEIRRVILEAKSVTEIDLLNKQFEKAVRESKSAARQMMLTYNQQALNLRELFKLRRIELKQAKSQTNG